MIYPDGTSEFYSYDGNRNILEKRIDNKYWFHYSYDSQNRIIAIKNSEGQEKKFTYDVVGNRTSITDENGNTIKYNYSSAGKLISVEDKEGNLTRYGYDCLGNVITIFRTGNQFEREMELEDAIQLNKIQHSLHLTLYERDLSGRVVSVTNPLGNKELFEYDLAGNLTKKTDREGYCTSFTYTKTGQVESIIYGDGDRVEYLYDSLQQLREVKDWLGTTTAEYDNYGRIQKITDHRGQAITYEFGDMGERRTLIYPNGKRVEYDYDNLLRLQEVRSGQSCINYQYGLNGKLTERICNNGLSTSYNYDPMGRLKELLHKKNETVLENYRYTYDGVGNKTGIWKYRKGMPAVSGEYQYQYDRNGRLVTVQKDGKTIRDYIYDTFNNRSARIEGKEKIEYIYNAADQMVQKVDEIRHLYTYDARGNLTEIRKDGIIENTYTYNTMNRMNMSRTIYGKNSQYIYNGLNKRVAMIEGDAEKEPIRTEYFLDMTKDCYNLLELKSQEKHQTYLWGNLLEGLETDGKESFALLDELRSPARFIWNNGNDMECYSFDEFGCDQRGDTGNKQPFSYTGYMADQTSGTYFAQSREYSPELGRFNGEDLVKGYLNEPLSLNNYTYCLNSPLNYIDVLGNEEEEIEDEYWRIVMEIGNDAHYTLRDYIERTNKKIKGQEFIPDGLEKGNGSGYSTKTGTGFADFVYKNGDTMEIWELKPNSANGKVLGPKQLKAYLQAIKNNKTKFSQIKNTKNGSTFNTSFNVTLDSKAEPEERQFKYFTDPLYPGMIFYEIIPKEKKKQPQEEVVLEPSEEKEKRGFWDTVKDGCIVVGGGILVVGGIVLFLDDYASAGFGTIDNGLGAAAVAKGMDLISKVFGSCPALY